MSLPQQRTFRAPGRVNLIGEHTDYNDGWVLPCAIDFQTRVAVTARSDNMLVLKSAAFAEAYEFDLADLPKQRLGAWCDYVLGIAVVLQKRGRQLSGMELAIRSDVPSGAGLSSSAAIEVASALAFLSSSKNHLPGPELARLCRAAENNFVGAKVGIMDQFVSCMGKAHHALLLDCRSLEYRLVPIPAHVRMVICNTMVKHELASGEYNRRRAECEEGVRLLSRWYPGIKALRDVSLPQLEAHTRELPAAIYKRCAHIISENQRTQNGADALAAGNLEHFGMLMRKSHESLRDLYEVSCQELDLMVEAAEGLTGYWGGRMTGGGFGGCTVNLVEAKNAAQFSHEISEKYRSKTGAQPDVYICKASDGAIVENC